MFLSLSLPFILSISSIFLSSPLFRIYVIIYIHILYTVICIQLIFTRNSIANITIKGKKREEKKKTKTNYTYACKRKELYSLLTYIRTYACIYTYLYICMCVSVCVYIYYIYIIFSFVAMIDLVGIVDRR